MARKRSASPEDAFLQDIIAHPDDDTPRLVFADWLDEHDQALRAEFIRLQCRLAATGEDDPERDALLQREEELLPASTDEVRWQPSWPSWMAREGQSFRRGFPAGVSLTGTQLLRYADKLFRSAPLEDVRLRAVGGRLGEVLASPHLRSVRSLGLREDLTVGDLRALAACPHLNRLERLELPRAGLLREELVILAKWPGLARLTHLALVMSNLDSKRLGALLVSPHLTRLTSLDLRYNHPLGSAGLDLLAGSSRLPALSHLNLKSCGIRTLHYLEKASGLKGLRFLDLSSNQIGAEGATVLAGCLLLRGLTSLLLENCSLANKGASPLAASPHLGRLCKLDLSTNGIGPEGLLAVARGRLPSLRTLFLQYNRGRGAGLRALGGLPALAEVHLSDCQLGPDGVEAMTRAALPNLSRLDLTYNGLGQEGVSALCRWPSLRSVRVLFLQDNNLSDEGLMRLAACPPLAEVRTLNLFANLISDEGLFALADSPHLGRLRKLMLTCGRGVTREGILRLASSPRLPHLLELRLSGFPAGDAARMLVEHGKGYPPDPRTR
jgi:uncharacterized protein (TIGR02996 family)